VDAGLEKPQASEAVDWSWASSGWAPGEQEGLVVYVCQSCGGEIIVDQTVGATKCPFCDNPVVVSSQFSGTIRPDLVIPFKVDKAAALAALKNHYLGKKLLPKVFKDENHLEEVKGVYVPFWLFSSEIDANLEYQATNVRHWSDSDTDYTETKTYQALRQGRLHFERVPVDGSSKMEDTLMESIEPYDYQAAVPFQTAFLSGFLANKYDVSPDACFPRADRRMTNSVMEAMKTTVTGYDTAVPVNQQLRAMSRSIQYGLLPVWVLNTSWNGSNYIFAINGQTGKLVGDLPMDIGAFWRWLLLLFGSIAGGIALIVTLIWMLM
jgi:DNA-directed RNA polymerase subunit RPC12/RpoP